MNIPVSKLKLKLIHTYLIFYVTDGFKTEKKIKPKTVIFWFDFMCRSCHFDRASNDKFSVEF